MEIMEDGNLVDRVRILLQRDMQYYQEMQTVLREPLCARVSGGKLDFPRHASFAAIKIVMWWEAEFTAAFKRASGLSPTSYDDVTTVECEGVVKNSQPQEFITLIVDTSEQLIEHLHTLIQEALDHADLTVLTATLGAAALVRNCLWCYDQQIKNEVSVQSSDKIHKCFKTYHEMAEAVAERLLDLHCRLISLYILNEADSLDWQNKKPFFEMERCSFVIQMWWLYMQGTRADLWNTVPPKMAQRVFSGMLNDSLTIITTRFIHGRPSPARSEQFWADAFNVLCCTAHLALGACVNGNEMAGLRMNKLSTSVRDIHAKCHELLVSLLLRGTPLKVLFQVFRDGLQNLTMSQPRCGPAPWLTICAPHLLHWSSDFANNPRTLSEDQAVILELNVLKLQPQPNWSQLMKVLSMKDCTVAAILFKALVHQCIGCTTDVSIKSFHSTKDSQEGCGGFLCSGNSCYQSLNTSPALGLYSLTYILVTTDVDPLRVIIPIVKEDTTWNDCLDRQQVWNQTRPPWLSALLTPLDSMMLPIVETLLEAAKTGASIYQAMSLALTCLTELYMCAPVGILRTALELNENIPAHCHPLGGSVLLQILCAALYSALLKVSNSTKTDVHDSSTSSIELNIDLNTFNPNDKSAAAAALAEALCSIDEDNKHTLQIDSLLNLIKDSVVTKDLSLWNTDLKDVPCVIETHADELLFTDTGRRSLKVIYDYLVRVSDWILDYLRAGETKSNTICNIPPNVPMPVKPLTHIMFHIEDTPFDQLLTDHVKTNWQAALRTPLSITENRICNQILIRSEFKNIAELALDEREAAHFIKRLCTAERSTRFK